MKRNVESKIWLACLILEKKLHKDVFTDLKIIENKEVIAININCRNAEFFNNFKINSSFNN